LNFGAVSYHIEFKLYFTRFQASGNIAGGPKEDFGDRTSLLILTGIGISPINKKGPALI
jgi:hypothetical protein